VACHRVRRAGVLEETDLFLLRWKIKKMKTGQFVGFCQNLRLDGLDDGELLCPVPATFSVAVYDVCDTSVATVQENYLRFKLAPLEQTGH
jgi:hypothetical protein